MKIKLKLSQLKRILKSEQLKLPITFKADDFTEREFLEFSKLLQKM
jgi:hypothetical protein